MVNFDAMGKRMRMKRRARKMSQAEVASLVNISTSFYSNIERGIRVPSIDTLVAIANALDTGLDYILGDSLTASKAQFSQEDIRTLTRYLHDQIEELDYQNVMTDA